MRFGVIDKLTADFNFSVDLCCKLLKVSRSGFYSYRSRDYYTPKQIENLKLTAKVETAFYKNKKRYGSPRLTQYLKSEGEQVGRHKVAYVMRKKGLSAKKKKSYKPKTTINNPNLKKSARIFKIEGARVKKENKVWCSDLTYIPFGKSFLYLVVYLDLYNRKVKSWSLDANMKSRNTRRAFLRATKGEDVAGLVAHSDQGVQYCAGSYKNDLKMLNVIQSMSRKGNCYNNAYVESFFHTLKNELDLSLCDTAEEVEREINEYMQWYNEERLHSSLGYMSPVKYTKQQQALSA